MKGVSFVGHAAHLVRRGAHRAKQLDNITPEQIFERRQELFQEIPASGIIVIVLTLIAFGIFAVLVDYALKVVFTLAAVEDSKQDSLMHVLTVKPNVYTDAANGSKTEEQADVEPEKPLLIQQYRTAGIRSTLRHLVSIGGKKACWRGFSLTVVYDLAYVSLYCVLYLVSPFMAAVIPRILLCTWEMGWVHIVITQQSPDPWYRRIPPFKTFQKICIPTAFAAVAYAGAAFIPVVSSFGVLVFNDGHSILDIAKIIFALLLAFASVLFITVCADMTLARLQAWMLPDSEEPIINIDKTSDGRAALLNGESNGLSFFEAWHSYDWDSFRRVFMLSLKISLITLALNLIFILMLAAEVWVFVVPALRRAFD